MGCSALFVMLLPGLWMSAPEASERPDPDPPQATRPEPKQDAAPAEDSLRDVPFTPAVLPASTRVVVAPDLRDPFVVDAPADAKAPPRRPAVHGDLRDPFTRRRATPGELPAPADLRDPFQRDRPVTPRCRPTTEGGIQIQRPKQLRCPTSSAIPAPGSGTHYASR